MSRLPLLGRAVTALGAALCLLGAAACDEDGKTTPERCADPPLPIYDIQHAGAPADDNARFNDHAGGGDSGTTPPCVTEVGHGISKPVIVGGSAGTGGKTSTSGSGGLSGSPADAGAGGA